MASDVAVLTEGGSSLHHRGAGDEKTRNRDERLLSPRRADGAAKVEAGFGH